MGQFKTIWAEMKQEGDDYPPEVYISALEKLLQQKNEQIKFFKNELELCKENDNVEE